MRKSLIQVDGRHPAARRRYEASKQASGREWEVKNRKIENDKKTFGDEEEKFFGWRFWK